MMHHRRSSIRSPILFDADAVYVFKKKNVLNQFIYFVLVMFIIVVIYQMYMMSVMCSLAVHHG